MIHETLATGGNPETLALSYLKGGNSSNGKMICHISISHMHIPLFHLLIRYWYSSCAEMARCFGGGLKGNALSMHFTRNIKPKAQAVLQALSKGEDPLDTVPMDGSKGQILHPSSTKHITSFPYFIQLQHRH
jgi:hypothetical protein